MSTQLVNLYYIDQFHENQRAVLSIGSGDNLLGVLLTDRDAYIHLREIPEVLALTVLNIE